MTVGLTIIILVAIVGTFGDNNSKLMNTGTNPDSQEKFTLEEGHIGSTDEYGIRYKIEGTIKNNTDKQYSYVQVTFNLYDKDGAQIGSALANINNLFYSNTSNSSILFPLKKSCIGILLAFSP